MLFSLLNNYTFWGSVTFSDENSKVGGEKRPLYFKTMYRSNYTSLGI